MAMELVTPLMTKWRANPACNYANDYEQVFADIVAGTVKEVEIFRYLITVDLFFILQFVLEVPPLVDLPEYGIKDWPLCNSPFVVARCREVQEGPDGWTIDLWGRRHFKSSLLTLSRTIQRCLTQPNKCTMIASHTRPAAKKFLRSIMTIFDNNVLLKTCFPDVLYENPRVQSPKYSEDDGIIVRRTNTGRVESTVEAWGLKEGMPIGVHFDWIISDDLETKDDVRNPTVISAVRDAMDLTEDLLTEGGSISVVGTPYSHMGVYVPYLIDKKKADGNGAFTYRRHAATDDGTMTGKAVFLAQQVLDDIRARKGEYSFSCQQLCNPTPVGARRLESRFLQEIEVDKIPRGLYKFMMVDPAGDDITGDGDSWGIGVFGVEPKMDDIGASNVYILDALVQPLRAENAVIEIARMFRRNGLIMQFGIEKAGASLVENYVTNILYKEHGIFLSEDSQTLVKLRPAAREKTLRIENALAYPLYQGKLFMSTAIPLEVRSEIKTELDNFPFYHPDFLDAFAYLYDVLPNFKFGWIGSSEDDGTVVSMDDYEPLRAGLGA